MWRHDRAVWIRAFYSTSGTSASWVIKSGQSQGRDPVLFRRLRYAYQGPRFYLSRTASSIDQEVLAMSGHCWAKQHKQLKINVYDAGCKGPLEMLPAHIHEFRVPIDLHELLCSSSVGQTRQTSGCLLLGCKLRWSRFH